MRRHALSHTHVDANGCLCLRQWRFLHLVDEIDGDAGRTTNNAEGLQVLSVRKQPLGTQFDRRQALHLDDNLAALLFHHAGLRVHDVNALEPLPRLEAREARLFASLHAPEEGVEGAVQTVQDAACGAYNDLPKPSGSSWRMPVSSFI